MQRVESAARMQERAGQPERRQSEREERREREGGTRAGSSCAPSPASRGSSALMRAEKRERGKKGARCFSRPFCVWRSTWGTRRETKERERERKRRGRKGGGKVSGPLGTSVGDRRRGDPGVLDTMQGVFVGEKGKERERERRGETSTFARAEKDASRGRKRAL